MDAEKKRAGLERRDFLRVMGAGAAGAAAAAGLLLIPAVLVLERVRPSGSERRAA